MISSFFKKCGLNLFISKDYAVVQKFFCSFLPQSRALPKEIAKSDSTRDMKPVFHEHFIENLFLNKIELTILEYPQIDSLKEVESLDKISRNIKNLVNDEIASIESKDSAALDCLKNFELSGFQLPVSQNGYGFLNMEFTFIQETLRNINSSLAKIVAENENFGIEIINKRGSEEQKGKYLPKLAKGESLCCFAYLESEPFISLDPFQINLEAVKSTDGETFTVSGKKNWVYNAKKADLLIFLANTTSSDNEKVKQPTLFLVDKNLKGIIVNEPVKTIGLKDIDICSVTFNEVEVPSSSILGKLHEGETLFRKLYSKRKLSDGVQCLAIMKKLANLAINHCIHNVVFKKNKYEHQLYKIKVGKLISRIYAVESMVYLIAGRLDQFYIADVFLESLILKIFSSESLQYVLQEIVTLLGTDFFSEENKDLRKLATDFLFFSSCEHTNDYLKVLISSAGFKHIFNYKKNRLPLLTSLKDYNYRQETQEAFWGRTKETFNTRHQVIRYTHKIFYEQSGLLEDTVFLLKKSADYLLKKFDKNIYTRHVEMHLVANMVVNIYTMVAILGRCSRAYCLGFHNAETDRKIAEGEVLRLKNESYNIANQIKDKKFFENFYGIENKIGYHTNHTVLPYVDGGHFLKLLKKVKQLNEEAARFFAGQVTHLPGGSKVILAIEYLHYMGIIYRDLKPENLLLDIQGYLKLVDFGFSKSIGKNHSYTFCGTPEYIAPEIILSKGYRLSPDWWALGILLYEMCSGTPPFTSKNELKLYEKIIIGKVMYPEHFSYDLKSLIQGLLQVDRSKRLGCMKNKAQDIKVHSWFSRFDWTALWNKKILPPIKYERGLPTTGFRAEGDKRLKFSITKCKTIVSPNRIGNIDFAI